MDEYNKINTRLTRKALGERRPPPSSSGVHETAEQPKCKTWYNLALRQYRHCGAVAGACAIRR